MGYSCRAPRATTAEVRDGGAACIERPHVEALSYSGPGARVARPGGLDQHQAGRYDNNLLPKGNGIPARARRLKPELLFWRDISPGRAAEARLTLISLFGVWRRLS